MAAHVGQCLADDLGNHFSVTRGQQVLGAVARQLDTNPIQTREVVGLPAQVTYQALRADRRRAHVCKRFTDALE